MRSVASVKARLKNQAAKSEKTMQEALITYGLERTIYRMSISPYRDNFTLKGGIFLYALFDGGFARATRDIDLLAKDIPNSSQDIKQIFENIFSIHSDDALSFDLDSLSVRNITEFKKYHGVNVSITAYLERTKVPISIDIGFGDIIYPKRVKMDFPVLLDMEAPEIFAYSITSVIAEKFEAIVSLGDANSRYKDFYDIYVLAERYDLDGEELNEAVRETFEHRSTGFDDVFVFTDDFINSKLHQSRWKAFLKKKKALENADLEEVVHMLRILLLPIVNSIKEGTGYSARWDHESQSWKADGLYL